MWPKIQTCKDKNKLKKESLVCVFFKIKRKFLLFFFFFHLHPLIHPWPLAATEHDCPLHPHSQ